MARNMELSFMLNPSLAGSSQVSRRIPIPQPRRSLCTVRPMSCCVRSHCNTHFVTVQQQGSGMLARYGLDKSEVERWMNSHAGTSPPPCGMLHMSLPTAPPLSLLADELALQRVDLSRPKDAETGWSVERYTGPASQGIGMGPAGLQAPAPPVGASATSIDTFAHQTRDICQYANDIALRYVLPQPTPNTPRSQP